MNSLLPILVSPQSGPSILGGDGPTTGLLGQVSTGQSKSSSQTFAQAFSQVLNEQGDTPAFLKQLQTLISTRSQHDGALPDSFLQNEVRSLKGLVDSDLLGNIISKVQVSKTRELPKELLPLASDSDMLLEIARLLSPPLATESLVVTNESAPSQNQGISFEQNPIPGIVPTIPLSPLQGIQPLPRIVFPGHEFQQSGEYPTLGQGKPEAEIDGTPVGNSHLSFPKILEPGTAGPYQGSLPKVTESAFVPQQAYHETTVKQASLGLKLEEGLSVPTVVSSPKDVPGGLQQVGRFVVDDEISRPQILQRTETPLLRSHTVQAIPIPPTTPLQAEGPAGFAGPGQTNQLALKTIPGNSSVLSEASGSGSQHFTTVQIEVTGESELLAKGERGQTNMETSVKSLGVDPGSGQGLGNGMNHFTNSQSGFQQPHMFSGQGIGLRAMEERGVEFPAQTLQRLQMDVQLSDNQRVLIDVGVQNKQVYAGLVMDHSILRNLANQFVPQLEHQLSQVDLELQEFSAEVREERQQKPDTWFDDSRSHEGQQSGQGAPDKGPSTQQVNRQVEQGLHLLA